MQKSPTDFHPKVPDGPQRSGKQCKKQNSSPQCAQEHIAPQNALRPAQCEKEERTAKTCAVDGIQCSGQAGTALPHRAQKIVQQSGGRAQQN